ncbi:hypothetical protein M9H77_04843 [Catharanthus roseus]|uniref:Uncharacterized protein n=1 Tax=Catharanthus roseus TaxID=4058 RepID=A0ACC0CFB1_CATRO|nr:hypothetical protein M9H77_04843 [Catharanthus roseus]
MKNGRVDETFVYIIELSVVKENRVEQSRRIRRRNGKKSSVEQQQEKDQEKLKGVADLYGGTTGTWEDILGEHCHHGYYDPGSTVSESDNAAARIRMIDEVLRFGSVFSAENQENKPKRILDIGCGIGGTCRYLARKYVAHCTGITISSGEVSFEVADALALPFTDGQFDLVWCMETAEYIPEKEQLVKEDDLRSGSRWSDNFNVLMPPKFAPFRTILATR